jgi:predicted small integral membrane protein
MSWLSWMAWTRPVAIFFVAIGAMLAGMTAWEIRSPTIERKGLLSIVTTRGDRLFVGLLLAAFANLAWMGATDLNQWWGAAIGAVVLIATMRWG